MRFLTRCIALFGAGLATAAFAADGAVLADFYNRVESLRADFSQVQLDEDGEVVEKASGIFLLDRPDRFRWEYQEPYRQTIVSNGQVFSFYDVDLAQVTVRDVDETLRTTPAQLLAGGAELEEAFEVVTLADGPSDLDWVRLTPRAEQSDFRRIRMEFDAGLPVRLELDDQLGHTTRIEFSDIRINGDIDDRRFRLKLPENVDIVDDRSQGEAP